MHLLLVTNSARWQCLHLAITTLEPTRRWFWFLSASFGRLAVPLKPVMNIGVFQRGTNVAGAAVTQKQDYLAVCEYKASRFFSGRSKMVTRSQSWVKGLIDYKLGNLWMVINELLGDLQSLMYDTHFYAKFCVFTYSSHFIYPLHYILLPHDC